MRKIHNILFFALLFVICSCSNYQKSKSCYETAREYSTQSQDADAVTAYLQALDAIGVRSLHSDSSYILRGRIYSNIAYICGLYGENDMAVRYFSAAGEDYLQGGDTMRYVGNLLELARIYNRDKASYETADSLMLRALRADVDSTLQGRIADTYSIILDERGETYPALVYAQRAVGYPAKSNDTELLPYRHFHLAQLFAKVGLTDSVKSHAQYVVDHSSNPYYLKPAYQQLAALSKSDSKLSEALQYTHGQVSSTEHAGWRSEALQECINTINEWEERKISRRRIILITCIIALLLAILSAVIWRKHRKEKVLRNQIDILQERLEQTTDKYERKQINRQLRNLQRVQEFCTENPDFCNTDKWKNDSLFSKTINAVFPRLLPYLEEQGLNLTEQRICLLVLLDRYSNNEIADFCYISPSSMSKTKSRISAKLNTTTTQLRQYLIGVI